jgi:hypothetical protein
MITTEMTTAKRVFLSMVPSLDPSFQGTGSYPPAWKGWHRRSLRAARYDPLKKPCFTRASFAYCEQLGTYRQDEGSPGEMTCW